MSYLDQNRAACDAKAEGGSRFAKVAGDAECADPLGTLDARGWLPESVIGLRVLCLASGGGWQGILYAVAGADVTVVDLSPSMLDLDQREAAKRGVKLRTLRASMDDLSALGDATFDIVHQPVSTCYIPDIAACYREVARVLKPGGLYISQHKTPTSLQIIGHDEQFRYLVGLSYYQRGSLPTVSDTSYRETGTVEFLHRWEQVVGDLCRSGFVIEDLREPYRGDPAAPPGDYQHRGWFVAPYLRMKARRIAIPESASPKRPALWTPGT